MTGTQVKVDDLQHVSAFRHLSREQLQSLASVMVRRTYAPGQLIFLEGNPSSGVWFISQGRVRIIKQSFSGRLQGLCMVDSGKCFGSCPLFESNTNPADAQAVDEVVLLILPRDAFQRMVHQDTMLATVLLEVYSNRLAHLARLGEGLGAWPVAARINDCLLAYADTEQDQPVIELTHEKLAVLVGTAREVVTRHLDRLEQDGLVRLEPGQIILLNAEALNTPCIAT